MGIGAAIFLMAVGAILTFAVDVSISGLDIEVVGVILMIAGAIAFVLDVAVFAPRRRRPVTSTENVDTYTDPAAPVSRFRRRRTTTEYYPNEDPTAYPENYRRVR